MRALVDMVRTHMTNGKRYRTIRVYVARTPQCDARSFPGGTIVFSEGLLHSAGSEAAVVGLVGHELSHLDREHVLTRARRIKLAQETFAGRQPGGWGPPDRFPPGPAMIRLWTHPFQPEDELQADRDGARWAYAEGYDPRELGRLFLEHAARRKGVAALLPSFLQSHPDPEVRNQALLKLYDELEQREPKPQLYLGKENLRRRIPRTRQAFQQ